jgi:hypothetical protein
MGDLSFMHPGIRNVLLTELWQSWSGLPGFERPGEWMCATVWDWKKVVEKRISDTLLYKEPQRNWWHTLSVDISGMLFVRSKNRWCAEVHASSGCESWSVPVPRQVLARLPKLESL